MWDGEVYPSEPFIFHFSFSISHLVIFQIVSCFFVLVRGSLRGRNNENDPGNHTNRHET